MSKINFLDAPSLIPFPTKTYLKVDGAFLDEQPKTLPRIWEIDFLRGLCILLMIIDHFFFLGYHIYGAALSQTASGYEFVEFCYFYWIEIKYQKQYSAEYQTEHGKIESEIYYNLGYDCKYKLEYHPYNGKHSACHKS